MRAWQWKIHYATDVNSYCCHQVWSHLAEIFCTVQSRVNNCALLPWARRVKPLENEPPHLLQGAVNVQGTNYLLVLSLHLERLATVSGDCLP